MIRRTWAAVRCGRSSFSVAARDSTVSGVTGPAALSRGLSPSNPSRCQALIHRSRVSRE